MQSALGFGSEDQPDYSEQARECFKNWVENKIDDTLFQAGKTALDQAGENFKNLFDVFNDINVTPNAALKDAGIYYERISGKRGNFHKGLSLFRIILYLVYFSHH